MKYGTRTALVLVWTLSEPIKVLVLSWSWYTRLLAEVVLTAILVVTSVSQQQICCSIVIQVLFLQSQWWDLC